MGIVIFLLWMVLNAHVGFDIATLQIVLTGLVLSGVLYFFLIRFTTWTFSFDMFFLKNLHLFVLYGIVLLRDIIISNYKVIYMILKPHENPNPVIVAFDLPIKNEMLRSIMANSITITPGTITISCTGSHYIVHCLKKEYIDGIEQSTLVRLLMKMEARK